MNTTARDSLAYIERQRESERRILWYVLIISCSGILAFFVMEPSRVALRCKQKPWEVFISDLVYKPYPVSVFMSMIHMRVRISMTILDNLGSICRVTSAMMFIVIASAVRIAALFSLDWFVCPDDITWERPPGVRNCDGCTRAHQSISTEAGAAEYWLPRRE